MVAMVPLWHFALYSTPGLYSDTAPSRRVWQVVTVPLCTENAYNRSESCMCVCTNSTSRHILSVIAAKYLAIARLKYLTVIYFYSLSLSLHIYIIHYCYGSCITVSNMIWIIFKNKLLL